MPHTGTHARRWRARRICRASAQARASRAHLRGGGITGGDVGRDSGGRAGEVGSAEGLAIVVLEAAEGVVLVADLTLAVRNDEAGGGGGGDEGDAQRQGRADEG